MDGTTKIATFDELVASGGKRRFDVTDPLPVSGLVFRMRSLTERELSTYQAKIQSARDEKTREARLGAANRQFMALCLVDEEGNPIVPVKESGRMTDLDSADSTALYESCAKHAGVSTADLDALVKNSSETAPEPNDSPTN